MWQKVRFIEVHSATCCGAIGFCCGLCEGGVAIWRECRCGHLDKQVSELYASTQALQRAVLDDQVKWLGDRSRAPQYWRHFRTQLAGEAAGPLGRSRQAHAKRGLA